MILPLLILAAQVASVPKNPSAPTPSAKPGSGAELMIQCLAVDAMGLGASNGDLIEKGSLCIGYMEGYADAAKGDICIPPRSTMALIQSYLGYMKDHPKLDDMPKAVGLRATLDATFPCRK